MPAASTRALVAGIVDYAGTYPPAALSLADAAAEYARARAGSEAWLVGRLVVPAGALTEVAALASPHLAPNAKAPWRLSVVLGAAEAVLQLARVHTFNQRTMPGLTVGSVEVQPGPIADIPRLAAAAKRDGDGVEVFFETPLDADLPARLDAIAAAGAMAKVRTGGVVAEAIPPADTLAGFFTECAVRNVPAKATAGLHHAIRSSYPLTYDPGSETATMHGFLNVAVAAVFARAGRERAAVAKVLEETSPGAFEVSDDAIAWNGVKLSLGEIENGRAFFRSFGSCSIREPLETLGGLNLL